MIQKEIGPGTQNGEIILISSGSLQKEVIEKIMKSDLNEKIFQYMIFCNAVAYMKT